MSFTLKQAKYFVGVAEHGSFSRAATELAISQSTLTEAVKDLEAYQGLKLFERRWRGVEMTHHGHVFIRHAKSILAEISNAELSLAGEHSSIVGQLNIGVTSLTSGYVLSDLLSRFRRAQPEIEVSALEDSPEYLEHLLIGGELDVAVMLIDRLRTEAALHSGQTTGCLSPALGRGGALTSCERCRRVFLARPCLSPLVAGRRQNREPRRVDTTAGYPSRTGLATGRKGSACHEVVPFRRAEFSRTPLALRYRKYRIYLAEN